MTSGPSDASPAPIPAEAEAPRSAPAWVVRVRWTVALLLVWITLLRFPVVPTELTTEEGWKWGLGVLLRRKAQIGVDWIYTYGPLGFFLQHVYDADLFVARFLFELLVKAALVLVVFGIVRRQSNFLVRLLTLASIACLPACDDDAAYALLVLLSGLVLLRSEGRSARLAPLLALLLATLALVKFPLLVLGTIVVAIVALARTLSRRRAEAAILVATYLGGFLVGWALLGQSLANVPAYLAATLDLSRSYSDAMSQDGPRTELYGALAVLVLVAAAMVGLRRRRPGLAGACGALLLAASFLLAFKEGFTRHDSYHAARFFAFALTAVLVTPVAVECAERPAILRRAFLGLAGLVAAVGLACALRAQVSDAEDWPDPVPHFVAGARGLFHPVDLRAEAESRLADLRAKLDLPRLRDIVRDRPVDVLGNFQAFAILNRMNWTPRFCFQGYAAYTDSLAERNAACLAGRLAPPFLLVDGVAIDRRFPTVEDGPAVLRALQTYRPVAAARGFLLLRKVGGDSPEPVRILRTVLRSGQPWDPGTGDRPLLAKIRCRKTWYGRLRSFFLRTPEVDLTVALRTGGILTLRILPSLETTSFLLSPVLASVDDWIDAYTAAGAPNRVARFQIDERGSAHCFENFEVELEVLPALTRIGIEAPEADELHARTRDG